MHGILELKSKYMHQMLSKEVTNKKKKSLLFNPSWEHTKSKEFPEAHLGALDDEIRVLISKVTQQSSSSSTTSSSFFSLAFSVFLGFSFLGHTIGIVVWNSMKAGSDPNSYNNKLDSWTSF